MRPRAGIGNVEMVAVLLSGKLGTRLVLDEGAKHGLLALELSSLVLGIYPVEDRVFLVHGEWDCCK